MLVTTKNIFLKMMLFFCRQSIKCLYVRWH